MQYNKIEFCENDSTLKSTIFNKISKEKKDKVPLINSVNNISRISVISKQELWL